MQRASWFDIVSLAWRPWRLGRVAWRSTGRQAAMAWVVSGVTIGACLVSAMRVVSLVMMSMPVETGLLPDRYMLSEFASVALGVWLTGLIVLMPLFWFLSARFPGAPRYRATGRALALSGVPVTLPIVVMCLCWLTARADALLIVGIFLGPLVWLIWLVLTMVGVEKRANDVLHRGLCAGCRYDRRTLAADAACPECGVVPGARA